MKRETCLWRRARRDLAVSEPLGVCTLAAAEKITFENGTRGAAVLSRACYDMI